MRKSLVCLMLMLPVALRAGSVTVDYRFSVDDLSVSQIAGWDVIRLKGCGSTGEVGLPLLPQASGAVLIPSDAAVTGFQVAVIDSVVLPGSFQPFPAQLPKRLSAMTSDDGQAAPVTGARELPEIYPASVSPGYSTGIKSGFRICNFLLHPVRYRSADRRLILYRQLSVTVSYQTGKQRSAVLTPAQQMSFAQDVALLVDNPEDVGRFAPAVRTSDGTEVDYLIVTGEEYARGFEPFCEWKTNKGIRTEVRTTHWIRNIYPGRDLAERIRNCVIDFYEHRGLRYLLLAGDVQIVPVRHATAYTWGEVGMIPCDLYYGDLQGDWDANQNDTFGEYCDDVDLYSDIYVGRIAIDNLTDVNTFVSKVLSYERNPDPVGLTKLLLPSGWLWQSVNYHGRIVNEAIAGLMPAEWTALPLVDPPSSVPVRESINAGVGFAHPVGHGNQTGIYSENGTPIYVSSDAARQTNGLRKLCIMNSIACDPGDYEWSDCLAEVGTNNPNGGLIAAIMNSRYGWGTPPVMGPSERLDLSFYDFVFNYDSTDLGIEHARSKDAYRAEANSNEYMRYCVYELNLTGDPQLPLWHGPPLTFTVLHPETIATGFETLRVVVRVGATPVRNALVCARKGDEFYVRARTDAGGNAVLPICAAVPGVMTLFVSSGEFLTYEGQITVVAGQPMAYLSLASYSVDDQGALNPNRTFEPGETGRLYVTIRNTGSRTANNVRGTLVRQNDFQTVLDSVASYGTVAAGAEAQGDGFVVAVAPDAPQNILLELLLRLVADEGSWEIPFSCYVGYAGLRVAEIDSCAAVLSVTASGAIGYDRRPPTAGRGFKWPKSDTTRLFYGSFLLGDGADYVADNYYGQPTSTVQADWRLLDSLRYVIPLWGGNQQVTGSYTDAGHSAPRNIRVRQSALAVNQPGYDDFVILVYDVTNAGTTYMAQTYAGLAADFDIIINDKLHDQARVNSPARAAYMWNTLNQNPVVGLRLLSRLPLSNATLIDPFRYRYADSALTEDMKFRILNGGITQSVAHRCGDWAVAVATGPFELAPGLTQRLAFAVVAASDSLTFLAHCDSAQSWYDRFVGLEENCSQSPPAAKVPDCRLTLAPNPAHGRVQAVYRTSGSGPVKITVRDITGRKIAELHRSQPSGMFVWQPEHLIPGVYFVELRAGQQEAVAKLLILN